MWGSAVEATPRSRCAFVGRTIELRDQASRFDWDSAVFANDNARAAELNARVNALDLTWLDIVSECLCSALLPACPRPANTNCVPLAVITIGNGDCRVPDRHLRYDRRYLRELQHLERSETLLELGLDLRTLVASWCRASLGRRGGLWCRDVRRGLGDPADLTVGRLNAQNRSEVATLLDFLEHAPPPPVPESRRDPWSSLVDFLANGWRR